MSENAQINLLFVIDKYKTYYLVIIPFPKTEQEKKEYINPKTKRPLTAFQYKVYDLCSQVTIITKQ